jgi:hypothetical protein
MSSIAFIYFRLLIFSGEVFLLKKKSIASILTGIIVAGGSVFGISQTAQAQGEMNVEKVSKDSPVYLQLPQPVVDSQENSAVPQWHYSHQSHVSHQSHQSHVSHYSSTY